MFGPDFPRQIIAQVREEFDANPPSCCSVQGRRAKPHWRGHGYAPERNPDELLNHDVKQAMSQSRPTNRQEMKEALRSHLHRRQKQPEVVSIFFQAEHVRYAA